jgi:hypothetical protein
VTRLLAAFIGALLIADLVGIGVVHDDNHTATSAFTSTSVPLAPSTSVPPSTPGVTTAPATTVPDKLAQTVQQIEAFVEQHRGLKYAKPVKVELLSDAAFKARLLDLAKQDNDDLIRTGHVLTALGLLPAGTDLVKARDTLLGGAVIGLYDDKTESLLVRGVDLNPFVRTTLSHELTHALQDQVFHIDRPELDKRDDEAGLGFTAVVEGDAKRIEEQYRGSLSKSEQREAAREEAQTAGSTDYSKVPPVLFQFLVFPYARGSALVDALVRAGGQPKLDGAFKSPPTTSEQVLHPDRFMAGEALKAVADPAADGDVLDKGTMGEFVLELMLETVMNSTDATRDAAGWGGDRYVAWTRGDQTCARVSLTMDTANDQQELRTGLEKWAGEHDGAQLSGTDPLTLTNCA